MPPEEIEIFYRSPLRENSGSMQFVETKKRSLRPPKERKVVGLSSFHTNVNLTTIEILLCLPKLGALALF